MTPAAGKKYFAHSLDNRPESEWQPLEDHLLQVAELSGKFAGEFGCSGWGYLAGLWHDLGKYTVAFQKMINSSMGIAGEHSSNVGRVDHSTAGAIHVIETLGPAGRILAYLIAGHHAGLPDWQSDETGNAALTRRLENEELLNDVKKSAPPLNILSGEMPVDRPRPGADPALWIRMLFSCLVDADFIDTERFYNLQKSQKRGGYPLIEELIPIFEQYMGNKLSALKNPYGSINRIRLDILNQCKKKVDNDPGIFTLSVPTGGGKTLSSMAFALSHATIHKKRRIIYVIPYTSIIEQIADQFREIFGGSVIEHHSNIVEDNEKNETSQTRLACENWDAPIIVTTTVQFFESLFSCKTSRCRKLHNIVNSIVILDEVQLLPPEYLNPILFVIKKLNEDYGATFLLSTATQPAFSPQKGPDFSFPGLPDTIEIIENPDALHRKLKRISLEVPGDLNVPTSWSDLAGELQQYPTLLCIVNRRDDCFNLHSLMPEGTFHLSGLMCGAHRSKVIEEIRDKLTAGIPTKVISTQIVEAGVDFDFPVVYRALAGLDSIAQAAGRCNREDELIAGKVVVFVPPSTFPVGYLRQAGELGRRLLSEDSTDHLAPERFYAFFKELYWLQGDNLDRHNILRLLASDAELRFSFRSASREFKIIKDAQVPVLVRYGKGADLIDLLYKIGPNRELMRSLQRFVVNIPRYAMSNLVDSGSIEELKNCPGTYAQISPILYHPVTGVQYDVTAPCNPELLIT
ncbi:MAG: CRISPR-associated helicase Cas3' [PVC group bacterium]